MLAQDAAATTPMWLVLHAARTLAQPAASSVAATFSFSLMNTVPNSLPPACSSV